LPARIAGWTMLCPNLARFGDTGTWASLGTPRKELADSDNVGRETILRMGA